MLNNWIGKSDKQYTLKYLPRSIIFILMMTDVQTLIAKLLHNFNIMTSLVYVIHLE